MIAYVTTQGAHIVREGERLIVQSENARNILFSSKLEQLILFGNVSISAPARHLLLRKNIDTVFIQKDGRYMGRLFTRHPGNALLRKRQFLMQDDIPFRLAVAKDIITGKILNQATLMARIRRARRQPAAGETARELQRYAAMIPGAESLDVLRGLEGRAAAAYFRTFSCGFSQDWGFSRRLRRPAPDPVNAVLSLMYTLLAARCTAALRVAGLDTQPGILHELSYNRDSLSLDLMEEFRPMIADTLTLALFNMRVLDWDDFTTPQPDDYEAVEPEESCVEKRIRLAAEDPLGNIVGDAACAQEDVCPEETIEQTPAPTRRALLLNQTAYRAVLSAWSKKLDREFLHPEAGREMSYAEAIAWQARHLRQVIAGEADRYRPLMLR